MSETVELTERELATILPALEHWKEELAEGEDWIPESNYFRKYSPLTKSEVDALGARLDSLSKLSKSSKLSLSCQVVQQLHEHAHFRVPTYFGNARPEEIERGGAAAEFDDPHVPVFVYLEAGIRILLGTDKIDDNSKPDIKIERRPKGWAIFLHPLGATDPSGYIYFLDDGRSFLVRDDRMVSGPIHVLRFGDEVPELDSMP